VDGCDYDCGEAEPGDFQLCNSLIFTVEGGKRLKKNRTGTSKGKGKFGRKTGIILSGFWVVITSLSSLRSKLSGPMVYNPEGRGSIWGGNWVINDSRDWYGSYW